MNYNTAIKALLSLTFGFVFWFLAFLVFMVYSFMPVSKLANSVIFAVGAPAIYLTALNLFFKKMFKESGWPIALRNLAVTLVMTGLALLVIDMISRVFR